MVLRRTGVDGPERMERNRSVLDVQEKWSMAIVQKHVEKCLNPRTQPLLKSRKAFILLTSLNAFPCMFQNPNNCFQFEF